MLVGAFIAAASDLTFDAYGYMFIMGNNLATASYGAFTKKKLKGDELTKWGAYVRTVRLP